MGETANYKLPYPVDGDAPDGPAQIEALANALDAIKYGSPNLKPTLGLLRSSSELLLTSAYQNVPGCKLEITPAVASILKVTIVPGFAIYSTSGLTRADCIGTVKVDAETEEPGAAIWYFSWFGQKEEVFIGTPTQVYLIPLTAATKHTIQMRAKVDAPSGAPTVYAAKTHSSMLYELYAA